ncbi:MAG: GNAT family N-acetyltransferase [Acetatifactor sp.]
MNLETNPVLYAGLIQILKRGTAEILEETENGIFLLDTVSNGVMLAVENVETGKEWLRKHSDLHSTLFSVFDRELVDFIRAEYGLTEVLDCYQSFYPLNTPPTYGKNLQIRCAAQQDLPLILAHYDKLNETELKQVITRGNLFLAFHNEEAVGFVGEHLEGSMGLLEVFPDCRRQGYGAELESFMISRMLERGLLPYCQVEVDNEKSLALQRKLGMTMSREKVYWVF